MICVVALLLHRIELFEELGDSIDFVDSFAILTNPGMNLSSSEYNFPMEYDMVMDNDLIVRTVDMAFRSLTRIQKDLNEATLPGLMEQLVSQFKQTMVMVSFFLVKLLHRSSLLQALDKENQSDNSSSENSLKEIDKKVSPAEHAEAELALALKIFRRVCKEFAVLRSPNSGYWAPLPHVIFDQDYSAPETSKKYERHYHLILQLFIDNRLNVDATDSDGNTLLHIMVGCSGGQPNECIVRLVKMLLDNRAHSHCRNKNGRTPLDVARAKKTDKSPEIIELLEEHMRIPSLKCIAAKKVKDYELLENNCEFWPAHLIKFVNIH